MKNASDKTTIESATDTVNCKPGKLPKRTNTVTAAVLASLLESKVMTGMDSVFKQSTTRLAAVIDYLERKYDWQIPRCKVATGTKDGRVTTIAAYRQTTLESIVEAKL